MPDYEAGYLSGLENGREGWPTVYDITIDKTRLVTQEDVAKGQRCEAAIGFWREAQAMVTQLALEIGQGKITIPDAKDRLRSYACGEVRP